VRGATTRKISDSNIFPYKTPLWNRYPDIIERLSFLGTNQTTINPFKYAEALHVSFPMVCGLFYTHRTKQPLALARLVTSEAMRSTP
jgi:hypothetical protein